MADSPTPSTLAPSAHIDSAHPAVVELAARARGRTDRERAVSLYHLVRDGFRYDAYRVDLSERGLRASTVIENGYGWCVPKAALLAAVARAAGIPARVGYADVRNHLSTQRMRDLLRTDLYVWHGYTELWIDGRWLKATPAFNVELCERFGLLPLEWDGKDDSIYHPFDRAGHQHMEYVHQRGSFDDVPRERISADFARHYPYLMEQLAAVIADDRFQTDVERETG